MMSASAVISFVHRNPVLRRWMAAAGHRKTRAMLPRFSGFLRPGERLLDIGAGTCNLAELLMAGGYDVTALDVRDTSFVDGLHPELYDGDRLPYGDQTFDVALLISMLHHLPDPIRMLMEARRVARRLVVVEDIYSTVLGKYITFGMDSLLNLEFISHPRTNKDDSGWRASFQSLGMEVENAVYNRFLGLLKHANYHLVPMKDQASAS